ncbi:uncharacterized protein KNAG_0F01150 [Huiozyma naganishii CBS 8797]|uniref:Uncharacterized protein n=1 Tax=Huiozyma naganishii (strain ATCC MYA-139 / BCRC 22969 / CBS 8797 / KCTC 17520 / NBRC 10181 / NCYC 3082 / Yp74L-3) TaxID=1071383 RepID=J7RMJ3_HUIN7|nr:hypothetical protein KNAG_0F01150 [Kazachstania naganishii CBS 8797]CCK70783.1 hypothetical protein KNAG_0F01150 [Kazachstania naganishii CBS 8797]
MSTLGVRIPKKSKKGKNKVEKRQLVTPSDFYEEATELEDNGERWLLSDVKKSLRFYLRALDMYDQGLHLAQGNDDKLVYDILYNRTRLMLQLYTEYMANDGHVNLLQYINLDDLPQVSMLRTLPLIIQDLEQVYSRYHSSLGIDTWDLQFNLLTSYLLLLESTDLFPLDGAGIVQLTEKFVTLSTSLIQYQFRELDVNSIIESKAAVPNTDTELLQTERNENTDEIVDISDQITLESVAEVTLNCLKFNETLMELLLENRDSIFNATQLSHLSTIVSKSNCELRDTLILKPELVNSDIEIALYQIECVELLAGGQVEQFESRVTETSDGISPELSLAQTDLLGLYLTCIPEDTQAQWRAATLLGKKLAEARAILTKERQKLQTQSASNSEEQRSLSYTVYRLCTVMLSAAENEQTRFQIKLRQGTSEQEPVMHTLQKNAATLRTNAATIAKASCGLQETMVDKLKRNYVYQQTSP